MPYCQESMVVLMLGTISIYISSTLSQVTESIIQSLSFTEPFWHSAGLASPNAPPYSDVMPRVSSTGGGAGRKLPPKEASFPPRGWQQKKSRTPRGEIS